MKTAIILFDGPCVLCNAWINRLCKWDHNDQLRFATLESKTGKDFFKERNLDPTELESVVFWIPNVMYALEAQATFELFKILGGRFSLLTIFNILPQFFTRGIYRVIARNRYRWFGKLDSCPLPNSKFAHKFLE
jgi:predicted DCC family thiol-disulfide oxidoreductase YuxK